MAEKYVTLNDENGQPIYPETRAEVVKTLDGTSVEKKLNELAEKDSFPEAPKDGKTYGRKDGTWEEVKAGDTITKEAIEKALTGNITTHTHDRVTQAVEKETDVWDGSTVSDSLQGSGTEDDPYQINSCADWVHFINNGFSYSRIDLEEESISDENIAYLTIKKHLDFGGHEIDLTAILDSSIKDDVNSILSKTYLLFNIDGEGSIFKNFMVKNWSILGFFAQASFHNLGVEGSFVYDLDHLESLRNKEVDRILSISCLWGVSFGLPGYSDLERNGVTVGNCYIKGHIQFVLSGNWEITFPIFVCGRLEENVSSKQVEGITKMDYDYKNFYAHLDFSIKGNISGKLITVAAASTFVNGEKNESYDLYEYTTTKDYNIGPDFTPTVSEGIAVFSIGCTDSHIEISLSDHPDVYHSYMLKSINKLDGIYSISMDLEDMKRPEFLALLNESGDKLWITGDDGLPTLDFQPKQVVYDGYVRRSEFEASVKEGGGSYCIADYAKLDALVKKEEGSVIPAEIISALGGIAKIEELVEVIESQKYKSYYIKGDKEVLGLGFSSLVVTPVLSCTGKKVSQDGSVIFFLSFVYIDFGKKLVNVTGIFQSGYSEDALAIIESLDLTKGGISIVDNLTSTLTSSALSANIGRKLNNEKVGSTDVTNIRKMTRTAYDGLPSKDSKTLYIIVG